MRPRQDTVRPLELRRANLGSANANLTASIAVVGSHRNGRQPPFGLALLAQIACS